MKIISFTMVNNESEIIESFVRYNYNFVDKMVIIDNGCTDRTIEIVNSLRLEGYDIDVYDESLEAYNQFRLDNKYLNIILNNYQPDLVIPLDADEFLDGGENNPRTIMESLPLDRIYYMNWKWYVLTGKEDQTEKFVPKRLKSRFQKVAWNSSDGTPVTKVIIPAKYFKENNLTLTMGHHDVVSNGKKIKTQQVDGLNLAHYRAISTLQIVSKTSTYVLRDIATMTNNHETAQHTNQMAEILQSDDLDQIAQTVSRGGYVGEIINDPLSLKYCEPDKLAIRYSNRPEKLADLLRKTGQEMAIRAYNSERSKKEKRFLAPVVVWMNQVRGDELIFPNPTNRITLFTLMFNVRGYLSTYQEIEFLKTNYRLIVRADRLKFIPHKYIIVESPDEKLEVTNLLEKNGIKDQVMTIKEYRRHIGIGIVYASLLMVPSLIKRLQLYTKRNGFGKLVDKLKERIK